MRNDEGEAEKELILKDRFSKESENELQVKPSNGSQGRSLITEESITFMPRN